MIVYCATSLDEIKTLSKYENTSFKMNFLLSYYYNKKEIKTSIAKNILIDSGAFTIQQKSKNITDIDEYFEEYKEYIRKYHKDKRIRGFFELDVQAKIGYEQVLEYRKELFKITDKIIPVWHASEGIDEFKRMCQAYDYISITSVKDREVKRDSYHKFVHYAHQQGTKMHGLGILNKKILSKIPFDSVDGTAWLQTSRFGHLDSKKIKSNYLNRNRKNLVHLELLRHKKFQEHFEGLWENYQKKIER